MFAIQAGRKRIEGLSSREIEILKLRSQGMTSNEIALALCRSVSTIVHHDKSILRKLSAKNMVQAMHEAHRLEYMH